MPVCEQEKEKTIKNMMTDKGREGERYRNPKCSRHSGQKTGSGLEQCLTGDQYGNCSGPTG